jgi:hypothetical protein
MAAVVIPKVRAISAAAAAIVLLFAGCGKETQPKGAASEGTTTTAPTSSAQPVPFFLFHADGWTLEGGIDSGPMVEAGAPLGMKWNASYESWPEPNHEVGGALGVYDPPQGDARELANLLTENNAHAVSFGGHPAYAGEERNTDGTFTASHITWDSGDYVVTFTVYETRVDEAVALAAHVTPATKAQWDAEMNAAKK